MKNSSPHIIIFLAIVITFSCKKNDQPVYVTAPSKITILEIIKANPSFSFFLEALKRTKTDNMLAENGPYTVLIPDNNAFARNGINDLEAIDKLDTAYLHRLILYHIIPKSLPFADVSVALGTVVKNKLALPLYFSKPISTSPDYRRTDVFMHINGDTVTSVDTKASNGFIHVLNRPLKLTENTVKDILTTDTTYAFFTAGLKKFNLFNQLSGKGPYTILAPTNSAFRQWGIGLDSIQRLDTRHFKIYLFSVSVLTPYRIFSSDFRDGPVYSDRPPLPPSLAPYGAFFSTDGILTYNLPDRGTGLSGLFIVVGPVINPKNDPVYSLIGPNQTPDGFDNAIIIPDKIAGNGVVHGLNNILIYPDSVRIK